MFGSMDEYGWMEFGVGLYLGIRGREVRILYEFCKGIDGLFSVLLYIFYIRHRSFLRCCCRWLSAHTFRSLKTRRPVL